MEYNLLHFQKMQLYTIIIKHIKDEKIKWSHLTKCTNYLINTLESKNCFEALHL